MLRPSSRAVIAAAAALALPAVAAAGKMIYAPEELREDLAQRLSADELAQVSVPYEINDAIRAWGRMVTEGVRDDPSRAEVVARAIVRDERLHAAYDASTTITAAEVFRTGKANCLSLTNLFIAIARDMGMAAYYVDVTEATHVRRAQDLIVAHGHICAGVYFPQRFVLYDFADQPERTYHGYRILDDREAVATFLLARTLNLLLRADPPRDVAALLDLARHDTDLALKVKPDFDKAYVNLGSAYLRAGDAEKAIEMYGKALDVNGRQLGAYLALGYVYAQKGRWKEARAAYEKAKDILPNDAVVRYHLGVAEYRDGDAPSARKTLQSALDLDPLLHEAWAGLGMALRAMGDEASARDAFVRAGGGGPDAPVAVAQ